MVLTTTATGSESMTKSELVDFLWEKRPDMSRSRIKTIVDLLFQSLFDAIVRQERIEIRGFGSFSIRKYKSYEGRNPKTAETIPVKSKLLPFFKVGNELKQRVNNQGGDNG